jgi:hypothetical protein
MRSMARLGTTALIFSVALTFSGVSAAAHPEPRVIVSVTELNGAHDRDAVQRAARESWGRIVRCYKQLGGRASGTLKLRLEISARGKVASARRLSSTLNDEVSECLAGVLRDRPMPDASAGSTATVELQLAPGDD